jgi:hypothetical protein
MPIERAFAVAAEPARIWEALWSDLSAGDPARFVVEQSNWPSRLTLRVHLAGLETLITYRIEQAAGYTEVSAAIEPLTFRYNVLQVITLGRMRTQYELLLTQALANLKQAVEGG